ncbi:piggyBac transposable element-derived protein 3-like [Metopolophium dirhodum]|uniref:piggyBac transposable element-derived protein 3-like n=1 Tax=Metopolophium dirhodum TaxID=44670 RepID=UPI00299057E0|nr:piggyBac transposable element-derived protein 3-like [Metopolophium dirhodum]
MNKFSKLNDLEIESILIEIPGDDGGLTDLEDDSDDEYLVERNNYLDLLDSTTTIQTSVLNIMDLPIEFSEESECIAGPSNAMPMHTPIFEDDHVDDTSEETDTHKYRKKKKITNKKNKSSESDMGWKKKLDHYVDVPDYNDFEGPIHGLFINCLSPTDVFLQVCGPILENICAQSNLYATQRGKTLNLRIEELKAFIGINFVMGYNSLPSWKDYWSTSNDLGVKIISDAMSRKRFDDILCFLHINDNDAKTTDNKDKLYKLRPLLDSINSRFPELYKVTREVSVDESMVLFKGRSSIKQYNPMKPIKRGYKIWCLGDQNGYISKFSVYQGKEEVIDDFVDFGLGERVVLNLTKPYWNKGMKVFFDNYFTSISLLEKLKLENTFACGTIRSNRKGIPPLAQDKTLDRGMYDFKTSRLGITVYKWKDNRIVHLASNFHGVEENSVLRTEHDGTKKNIKCPTIVNDYNKYMGGVDKADQLRALYNVYRKSKKWWHRLFWGVIDIIFSSSPGTNYTW